MKLFDIFLTVSILTHIIRTSYELLKIRNKINPENKILFSLIFGNMMTLWISWFFVCFGDPYKITLYPVIRYCGAGIFLAGVFLFVISLAQIKRFENYHGALITNGIYRYLRHPMYLGFIFWMAGSSLFSQSGISLLLTVIYTANIFIWKNLEEIQLKKVFPEYFDYMKRTFF